MNQGAPQNIKGARGGRRPNRDESPTVRISKALSNVLRHSAVKAGIPIRPDGFILISDLLQHERLRNVSFQEIQAIVASNDKQRFKLVQGEDGNWMIRANQGHSLKVEVEMTPLTSAAQVPTVIHGTSRRAWSSIAKDGLKIMGRQHIHFATGRPGDAGVISGMHNNCQIFITLDLEEALKDGIPFFISENQVVLSPGKDGVIGPEYFGRVEDWRGQRLSVP
ncbi:phosphotransferase KptA/Tpt1 [Phlyctochytrium arcticum]|nr:phosphotransferase KptA/Tpt1 [Phlyctochytrium arcticum]